MAAVMVRLRAELRARWRTWVGISLLLGLFGGAVLAIAAGARRTDTAYPRFLEAMRAYHVAVYDYIAGEGFAHLDLDEVAALPQVVESAELRFYGNEDVEILAPSNENMGRTFNRLKVLEGRLPDPDSPDEVTATFLTARDAGVRVGDVIDTEVTTFGDPGAGEIQTIPVRIRVVGITVAPGEFPPLPEGVPRSFFATPAFADAQDLPAPSGLIARLRNGERDGPAFTQGLENLAGEEAVILNFFQSEHANNVQRSFHLQAVALWLLAAFAALGITLVLGQTLRRQTMLESTDLPVLRSLGMSTGQLALVGIVRSIGIAIAGAATSVVVAFLLSPMFPTGIARIAEPVPGFAADRLVLGVGPAAIVALILLITTPAAVRAGRRAGDAQGYAELESPSSKPSLADGLARGGLPATMVAGARLALEVGRGRTAMPVRSTLAGVMLGIAALAAALTFDASLAHLLDTPEEFGLRWQALVNGQFGDDIRPRGEDVLAVAGVEKVAAGSFGVPLEIDRIRTDALAVVDAEASGLLRLIEGSAPRAAEEIVLGTNTLEKVGKEIGDTVQVAITGTGARPFRVVGRAVIPPIGEQGHLGEGALLDYSALSYIFPKAQEAPPPETLFVTFAANANVQRVMAALSATSESPGGDIIVESPELPADLINFGRVQNLPVILAGLLGMLASATLAHALITSIRRRRRDLAVLKTMGFVRRQIHAAVAWQAVTLTVIAAAIGVPLGIVGGRVVWSLFANELGVVSPPRAALSWNLTVIPVAVLLALVISLWPGRSAARTRPALILRTE